MEFNQKNKASINTISSSYTQKKKKKYSYSK